MGVLADVLFAGWRLGHKLPGFCWPESLVDEDGARGFDFVVTGCGYCGHRDVSERGRVVVVLFQEFEHCRGGPAWPDFVEDDGQRFGLVFGDQGCFLSSIKCPGGSGNLLDD